MYQKTLSSHTKKSSLGLIYDKKEKATTFLDMFPIP